MRCVRVVNVRGINDSSLRGEIVYVGRPFAGWPGHPLANPYKVGDRTTGRTANKALMMYRFWLTGRGTLEADLAALWLQTDQGRKPLGCWCVDAIAGDGSPVECHAQILAEELRQRFCVEGEAA